MRPRVAGRGATETTAEYCAGACRARHVAPAHDRPRANEDPRRCVRHLIECIVVAAEPPFGNLLLRKLDGSTRGLVSVVIERNLVMLGDDELYERLK